MGNKIWALALAGAAAYLFKTKKGTELRKNMTRKITDLAAQAKTAYEEGRTGKTTAQG